MARDPISPERYREIHEAHARARRLGPAERAVFLEELGREDAGLRAEVESLLAHEGSTKDPFAEVIGRTAAEILQDEAVVAASLPKRVGGYWVLGLLGEGAMGRVFEALQPGTGRRVALKVMRAGFLPAQHIRRFLQEARILGQLQHPGIAQIFEAGVAETAGPAGGETPYFAMELVRGEPLTRYASLHGLSIEERVTLLVKVCSAVDEAHRKGIVHRDLKPGNILVDGRGQPKVLDFGVAQWTDESDAGPLHTDAGLIMGTLPYMSPEQVAGERRRMDARSDIYGLGVLAYELLSGRLPLPVQNLTLPEAALVIRDEEPRRLGSLHRFLRGDLETIVAKALEKDPARRYASAEEMGEDFRRVLHHQPVLARPASAVYRMRKFTRRHKTLVAGTVAMFLVLVGGSWLLNRARLRETGERQRAEVAASEAVQRERLAVHQVYRASMTAAAAAHDMGNMGMARQRLEETPVALRGWEWWHVWSDLDESLLDVTPPYRSTQALAWSADGKRVVARLEDMRGGDLVAAWDGKDGTYLGEFPLGPARPARVQRDALRPGIGRWVLRPHEQELLVHDAGDGHLLARLERITGLPAGVPQIFTPAPGGVWEVEGGGTGLLDPARGGGFALPGEAWGAWAVSPGGDRIACGPADRPVVEVRDSRTGRVLREMASGNEPVSLLAWSSDGSRIVSGSLDRIVRIWSAVAGTSLLVSPPLPSPVQGAEWSPDGSVLATGGADGTIRILDPRSGQILMPYHGHSSPVDHLAWSPDGSRLASAISEDAEVRVWDGTLRREPRLLAGHSGPVEAVAVSPGGEMVASAGRDGTVRIWEPWTLEPLAVRSLDARRIPLTALAWSPDGKRIAVGDREGSIVVLDARTSREVFRERPGMGEARAVAFVRGNRLAAGFSGGSVILWDLVAGRRLRMLEGVEAGEPAGGVHALAVSPDGRRIAAAFENSLLEVLASDTLEPDARTRLLPPGRCPAACVLSVSWSPDGGRLAAGLGDGTVRLLDAGTCLEKRRVQVAASYVHAIAWSPDGKRIAAGTFKGFLLLLHSATGEEMVRLRKHPQRISSLAWLPDGEAIVTASEDYSVGVWSKQVLRESLERRRARSLQVAAATPLVLQLLDELQDPDRVAERLAGDPGLGDRERRVALQELLRIGAERESRGLRGVEKAGQPDRERGALLRY